MWPCRASTEAACDFLAAQYSAILGYIEDGALDEVYLKVVDEKTGTRIAWADWELPSNGIKSKWNLPIPSQNPWAINTKFCLMAVDAVKKLRDRVLEGKKYFCEQTRISIAM